MANLVAKREEQNGGRNLVIRIDIEGDGNTDITAFDLVDASTYGCGEVRLDKIQGQTSGFDLILEFDGVTRAPCYFITGDNYIDLHFDPGISNPKVPFYTGDVIMKSSGLGLGETGSLLFHFYKKRLL